MEKQEHFGVFEYTLYNEELMLAYSGTSEYGVKSRNIGSQTFIQAGRITPREEMYMLPHKTEHIYHYSDLQGQAFVDFREKIEREAIDRWRAKGYTMKNIRIPGAVKAAGGQKAYTKEYNERNKETLAAKDKARYHANKEEECAKSRAYHKDNKEEIAAKQKIYREANKEHTAAYMKEWYQANKVEQRAKERARYHANKRIQTAQAATQ